VAEPIEEILSDVLYGGGIAWEEIVHGKWCSFGPEPNIAIVFPNIAHDYWENYRLTGEFHVRPAKAPKLKM
jgi:hypothetical protein